MKSPPKITLRLFDLDGGTGLHGILFHEACKQFEVEPGANFESWYTWTCTFDIFPLDEYTADATVDATDKLSSPDAATPLPGYIPQCGANASDPGNTDFANEGGQDRPKYRMWYAILLSLLIVFGLLFYCNSAIPTLGTLCRSKAARLQHLRARWRALSAYQVLDGGPSSDDKTTLLLADTLLPREQRNPGQFHLCKGILGYYVFADFSLQLRINLPIAG